jgi:alkanesulfonate monooxygenase SsuD/methylene tetrahydromethanopterin reductase-like flavin-dependent oxidoreductase (luciferase family)
MRIGISVASQYDVADVRSGARFMVERARAANAAGLHSLFVGDHHVTPRPYYQNTAIMGRMLAEWGDRTAGALYLLPLWNPVLIAEQMATLACIAKGPFVLQCAIGGDPRQSQGMGVDPKHRVAMFEEALQVIRTLWRGDKVNGGRFWPLVAARIAPLPPAPIDVWIGASARPAIDRAARLGDAWLGDPGMPEAQALERLRFYRECASKHGKSPSVIAIRRDVYVGSSSAEARATMAPYLAKGHRGFPEEALLIGDTAEVAARVATLADMGYTDLLVRNITADQSQALATIERLARVQELVRR